MEIVSGELPVRGTPTPVIVCITDAPEERRRLAGLFDGVGVLVLAADPDSASAFLGNLRQPRPDATAAAPPAPDPTGAIRAGGLRLDVANHEASWHGRALQLTPYELKVLGCLASRAGQIWTYRQLHDHAWEGVYFSGPAAVQSVIKRLRAKLRQWRLPLLIEAVRGVGFRLAKGNDLHLVAPLPEVADQLRQALA